MTTQERLADASVTFTIGADLTVNRLGFGAMRITGDGVWGPPSDPEEAVRVLRRAVELGVTLIDTADSYGPFVSEELIRAALHPYPEDLVIATKAGFTRGGPGSWRPVGRPEYLRQQVELSLRHLDVDRIDVLQLHAVDPRTPLLESVGELVALQKEGKIRHIGLSNVGIEEIDLARTEAEIVSVQNSFNLTSRRGEGVLDYCEREAIGFIPYFPLAVGSLADPGGPLDAAAKRHGASPSQLALAWLLRRSPVMLPIPGTSKVRHLEENLDAARITLTEAEFDDLTSAV
jgi:aryl-alcohol dehydrogenase-like predicted oxidoreductase